MLPQKSDLSEDDVERIATAVWAKALADLKIGIGGGILRFAWLWSIRVMLVLALYGLAQSFGYLPHATPNPSNPHS